MSNLPLNNEFDRSPNNLDAFWMPFTWNRKYKKEPLMLTSAKGMHYTTIEGNQVLDGTAGLWCCNAGHACERITTAVQETIAKLDFAPTFQLGHPLAFELASRVTAMLDGYDHMFFCNSGSEAVDSALKIALAYHRARGEGQRTRLIGRERGYHGTGFGGISVGGIVKNRNVFGTLLAGVDHLPHTHNLEKQAYTKGQPEWGAHLADDLERICALHDPSTIAAVIVEPMAGSTGVLMPPKGYLEKLRAICDKHGILLIFDEVITGFGRLGTPFAVDKFGVKPDLITCAKGLTNGTIPMGGVICREGIYKAFEEAADNDPSSSIELFHGYTYSGHPVAAAAGLATLETYKEEGLFQRAQELEDYWGNAAHNLKGTRHVIDIRNLGLIGAIELESRPGEVGKRAYEAFRKCFEKGVLIRVTGDIIALSPPLIIEKGQIDQIFETIQNVLNDLD
ncbi:omega amino acid--pyruvate aminotransferase [Kiloniella litopenaei]|uniref:Omega amino acid--pyruvate aminotransferase n=1 Tax=Kiloniella litopenaei TaxID=1549748 RepID=A0A0M2R402_9PROT|nr:aspartate aminotransferase family protein [Kiloniella litopenaei]KKJ75159.1 omega amino acid--pyruvate aminotransferase [Kiloniella litopenaei]